MAVPAEHRLPAAFATLDALAASASTLPEGHSQPFGASWQGFIDQPDRTAALGCFRAATLMALKRALRNRSVSVAHSLSYQAPEDRLIPLTLWQRGRRRQALARAIGDTQFPDVLIEIDGLTRFSWILLRRPARSEQELVTLHAGLLGLGSDLSMAELARMLLANIIMAWNTHHLQAVIDLAPSGYTNEVMSPMAPIGHKHINLRGSLRFDFAQSGLGLLQHAPLVSNDRVSK